MAATKVIDAIRFQPASAKEPALSVITGTSLKAGVGGIVSSPVSLVTVLFYLFFYQLNQFVFMHNHTSSQISFFFQCMDSLRYGHYPMKS